MISVLSMPRKVRRALEPAGAVVGERETDGAAMLGVGCASDEAFCFGSVDGPAALWWRRRR